MVISCKQLPNKVVCYLLTTVIALTPVQIYVCSIYGIYVSVSLILSLTLVFLLPFVKHHLPLSYRLSTARLILSCLVLLICIQLISLLWSSDLSNGSRIIFYELCFIAIVCYCKWSLITLSSKSIDFWKTMNISLVVMGLISLSCYFLVLAQYMNPSLRREFLHSDWSKIFINPNTIELFRASALNSYVTLGGYGGLFVNPNVTSAYFGISSVVLWWSCKATDNVRIKIVSLCTALVLFSGVYFTGSEAGLILAVLLPLLAIFLRDVKYLYIRWGKKTYVGFLAKYIAFLGCLIVFLLILGDQKVQEHYDKFNFSYNSRVVIWDNYIKTLSERLWLGDGFGNSKSYPPHNTLIYLWSQSGFLAMIVGALFMSMVLWLALRLFMMLDKKSEYTGLTLGLVASWIFIHGMGENWGLVGEEHQYVIFAVMLGIACAQYEKVRQGPKIQAQARVASSS